MEKQNKELIDLLRRLKAKNDEIQEENIFLKKEIIKLTENIEQRVSETKNSNEKNMKLKEEIENLNTEDTRLKEEIQKQTKEFENLKKENVKLKKKSKRSSFRIKFQNFLIFLIIIALLIIQVLILIR